MVLQLKFYNTFCSTSVFIINDIDASYNDFGDKYDSELVDYGCGNMQFIGNPSTPEILAKYKINEEEYQEIISILKDVLSFGCCSSCV